MNLRLASVIVVLWTDCALIVMVTDHSGCSASCPFGLRLSTISIFVTFMIRASETELNKIGQLIWSNRPLRSPSCPSVRNLFLLAVYLQKVMKGFWCNFWRSMGRGPETSRFDVGSDNDFSWILDHFPGFFVTIGIRIWI